MDIREVANRAFKTFWQAAIPALVIPTTQVYNLSVWKGALITALSAGASAAWNGVVKPLLDKRKTGKL